jgi:Domain of unknown function (DUF1707)
MAGAATTFASDADRDRVASALREHLAADRLTIEEFDERLDRAFAAKTLGDLEQVVADLPRAISASFRVLRWTARLLARRWPGDVGVGRYRPSRPDSPRRGGRHGDPGSRSACSFW